MFVFLAHHPCRRQSDFTSPTMKLSSEGNQRGPQHTLCWNPLCILVRNPNELPEDRTVDYTVSHQHWALTTQLLRCCLGLGKFSGSFFAQVQHYDWVNAKPPPQQRLKHSNWSAFHSVAYSLVIIKSELISELRGVYSRFLWCQSQILAKVI